MRDGQLIPMPESAHGTDGGYTNWNCRCDDCRDAHADCKVLANRRRASRRPDHVHGTWNGYVNYLCRCDACREAASDYMRELRRRKREAAR